MPDSRNTPTGPPAEHHLQVMGVGPDVVADLEDLRDTDDERPDDGDSVVWSEARQRWLYIPAGGGMVAHALGGPYHTPSTLAELNARISDANVDPAGTARPPTAHLHTHASTTGQTANDHHNQIHTLYGANHTPANNLVAVAAPTVNDDVTLGYGVGSWWFDITADLAYVCLDGANGAAVWIEVTQAPAWVTSPSKFHATKADQNVNSGVWTKLTYDNEELDSGGDFDLANSKYIAPADGDYFCIAKAWIEAMANAKDYYIALYLNGVIYAQTHHSTGLVTSPIILVSDVIPLSAADEVEVYVYHTHGALRIVAGIDSASTFAGFRI